MKKKKLKKKIKKLEKNLKKIGEAYPIIRKDIDSDIDARRFEIKDTNEKLVFLKMQVDVLWEWLNRSGIDFSEWREAQAYNKALYSKAEPPEPTCETCRWKGLKDPLGPDSPCFGCTKENV